LGISFPPDRRSIILCNFDLGGFRPPEMVKRRPVVVIVGRLPHRSGLATVVPLSTTPPHPGVDYQCPLWLDQPLPHPFDSTSMWVKADMLASVSYERLDLFRGARLASGKRQYTVPKITESQFDEIRSSILRALRFER
jgi:mRNA interferase MazF